ncbi:MAG: LysM peptidoglycan-binding domain-containing protein [Gemmatimonadales bacterium]
MTISRSSTALLALLLAVAVAPVSMAAAQAAPRTYTVKPGDTLRSIAREVLGDGERWRDIFEWNSDKLSNPNQIEPGQVLRLNVAERATEPTRPAPAAEPPARRDPDMPMPRPEPNRPPIVIETPVDQTPSQEPGEESLFAKRRGVDAATALRTYREQPYQPLRAGEFYSSGFLTEGDALPFGRILGQVTPQQIRNLSERASAALFSVIAVMPPEGAQYQVGDSLLLVQTVNGPMGYGDIVRPTGMARVTGHNGDQAIAEVIAVYGAIRNGQQALPAEHFADAGTSRAQPVEGGVSGSVLTQRDVRELKQPQNVLFIDLGRRDGVARGDIFEIRRDAGPRPEAADTIDELMAVLQVVHVRERSATVRILNVTSPDIPPGTRVKQVGKLPG